jgi:hypothetical protein
MTEISRGIEGFPNWVESRDSLLRYPIPSSYNVLLYSIALNGDLVQPSASCQSEMMPCPVLLLVL